MIGAVRVAVIGAGVAGLVNARVLRDRGFDVVVHEARRDVGGVWSSTRGYPGQRLQDPRDSYAFSDYPMPPTADAFPLQAEVQAYLAAYARHHDLDDVVRLNSTLVGAVRHPSGGWTLTVSGPDGERSEEADLLVLATGVHSRPAPPDFNGVEAFASTGGELVDASDLGAAPELLGKHVVVVGFGKTGADVAVAAAERGASHVTVVARRVPWKLPYRLGRLTAGHLMLTRLGEHLLWRPHRTLAGRVVKHLDLPVQLAFRAWLSRAIRRQSGLDARGLLPLAAVKSASHLETHGFAQAVDDGRIAVRSGRLLIELRGGEAVLDDGSSLPADLVIMAIGYDQDLAVLDAATQAVLLDDRGRLLLHRHTIAEAVPDLAFAGWTESSRSPLVAELQALYIAAHFTGELPPVSAPGRRRHSTVLQLSHRRAAENREPQFSHGLTILEQDGWLAEMRRLPRLRTLLRELVRPMDPADYAHLHGPKRSRKGERAGQR